MTPEPAPAPVASSDTLATTSTDNTLPIAGGIGAAILLLGGGAYALSRRRRPDEEVVYETDRVTAGSPPVVLPEAAMPVAAAAYAAPQVQDQDFAFAQAGVTQSPRSPESAALKGVSAANLPAGFDLSRYGRHVQAAYRGPTSDNPSLSLKRRLARARFFDQRERMAAQGELPPQAAAATATPQPAPAQRRPEFVTTRVSQPPRPGFRPAYSS